MKTNSKYLYLIPVLLLSSCSTMNKTILYSSIGGSVIGGFVGKELSPNKKSDNLNLVIGATTGAALSAAIGYFFYKDANPDLDLDLKQSPLKSETPLIPISDNSFGMDKIKILPRITPKGDRVYLNVSNNIPNEVKNGVKKQFYKRYMTEAYTFDQNGKTYQIPSFQIIENGVD